MLNLLLVHDHSSPNLGTNCVLCQQHLLNNIDADTFTMHELNGDSCDKTSLQTLISSLNESPFVFVAYSHGNDEGLTAYNYGNYVSIANTYFFSASLFYTNACYSASSIGESLVYDNCKTFIGYQDEVKLPDNESDDIIFVECENYAIIEFLNTDKEIGYCFDEMKKKYTDTYDYLVDQNRIVLAARLALNESCLILDGDRTITRESFT